MTMGLAIRPRKQTYVTNDAAIKRLVQTFDAIADPNNDQILTHLRAIQYRLLKNNIENWD